MWNTITLQGKPIEFYEPPGTTKPRFGVLFLHDQNSETLRDRPAFTRVLDSLNLACTCPRAPGGWWVDRVPAESTEPSAERFLSQMAVPEIAKRFRLSERAIGLLGIGMGGQGALRLAFRYPEQFPVVAALGPSLDFHEIYGSGTPLDQLYESKEQCRQDTAILHIHPSRFPPHILFCIDPDDQPWYRGNDRLHEKLTALGIAHEIDFTTCGGGHSWEYFDRQAERALRFIHAGLELESRRLL
jgi:S-formylglutathione hydrolase